MNKDYLLNQLPYLHISCKYEQRKFPLHIMTVLAGHSLETSSLYYENRANQTPLAPYCVWQYTLGGKGAIETQEGLKELKKGQLMIVSVPSSSPYYLPQNSSQWDFVFLVMIGSEALRITRFIEQKLGNVIDLLNLNTPYNHFFSLLTTVFEGNLTDPFINSNLTYQLCMALLGEVHIPQVCKHNQRFENCIAFLKENLNQDITVDQMAQHFSLSRSHFSRLFKQTYGLSPRLYLEELRLKKATQLITTKMFTIKQIAALVGIPDVNYFCRVFKKHYKQSPLRYLNS